MSEASVIAALNVSTADELGSLEPQPPCEPLPQPDGTLFIQKYHGHDVEVTHPPHTGRNLPSWDLEEGTRNKRPEVWVPSTPPERRLLPSEGEEVNTMAA
jgi:hypothetical protein